MQLKPDVADDIESDVRQRLVGCESVEIHTEDDQLRLVITMEANTSKAALKLTEEIQNISGILSVTPVYQHCEENHYQDQQGGWKWR